ncbi:hypothetical protein J1614_003732 [Plenodomus biglobosus]|nr:hypothetical protein J1614_003732 [Plenodomus biglobosus]
MARLAAPPSCGYCRSPLSIPTSASMPIQSVSSTSSNPVSKRSRLPRPVLHQAAPKSQIARKATGRSLATPASSRSSLLLASPRVDYELAAGRFARSQIPRPATVTIRAAAVRCCSKIFQCLASVVVKRVATVSRLFAPVFRAAAASGFQFVEPEVDNIPRAVQSAETVTSPLPVNRVLLVKQQHVTVAVSPVAAPVKPSASRIPRLPVVKPARRQAAGPVTPPAASHVKRGSRSPVAVRTGRKVNDAPIKSKAASFLKRRTGGKYCCKKVPACSSQELVARYAGVSVKPTPAPVSKRARPGKHRLNISVTSSCLIVSTAKTEPARVVSAVPAVPAVPGLKCALRKPNAVRPAKAVQFTEGPFNTKLYSTEDTVEQLSAVSASPDETPEWAPLAPSVHEYTASRGNKGTKGMFELTGHGPMTLKDKFVDRFSAVQCAEKLRRREESKAGVRLELGQLEYGNIDYKIALRAQGVIKYEDIGTTMNASDFTLSASTDMGRVVVFGCFPGSFQDAPIRRKMDRKA